MYHFIWIKNLRQNKGKMKNRIIIDGSQGEGGGQILRTSLSLASLLGIETEIHNIRANRKKPGLRPQHLTGLRALAGITDAEVSGDNINSTSLYFSPQQITGGKYSFDIGTAGSTSLLLAAILPPLLFAPNPSTVEIMGGTHVPFSPVFHYTYEILLPFLQRMGADVNISLIKWGWYPKGGGLISVRVKPCENLQALLCDKRGKLIDLDLLVGLAGLPMHIAEREEERVRYYAKTDPLEFGHTLQDQIGHGR